MELALCFQIEQDFDTLFNYFKKVTLELGVLGRLGKGTSYHSLVNSEEMLNGELRTKLDTKTSSCYNKIEIQCIEKKFENRNARIAK